MEFKVESSGDEEESTKPLDFGLNPIVAAALRDLKDIDNLGLQPPKEEIKEEDEVIVEIKLEDVNSISESSALEETPPKRQRRKPIKYSDPINALASPKRNKKVENGKTEIKKGRKKKSESQGSSCEQIKVEPKFEIDLFENHEILTARCSVCKDDIQRTALELKQHFKEQHPGKRCRFPKFICETSPSCDICGKVFKTSPILRDHMETHNNYFFCMEDNHSTKKLVDHVIHLVVHSEDSIFRCPLCDFSTEDITSIKEHLQNHEKSTKYWCEACKKSFPVLSHFQEHDNFHTGLKPFNCEFCEKTFMYSRHLHAHKVAMHKEELTGVNVNQCPICLKEYRHRNSLKLHMNAHTGNFAICDVCGKTLCSKEKLKFHMRIHTGYKPYCCPHCGKCFTKKPILVEHIRVHTGERPYSCDYCTKTFSQRSSLVIHMRGHTGDKPYVCAFCSKAYAAKAMLTFHLKSCQGFANMPYLNI